MLNNRGKKKNPRVKSLQSGSSRHSLPQNLLPSATSKDPPTPKPLTRSISEDPYLSNSFSDKQRVFERPRSRPVRENFAFGTLENGFSGICRYRNVLWRCNLSNNFHTEFIDQELLDFIRDLKTQRKKYNKLRHRYINDGSRNLRQEVYLHIHEPVYKKESYMSNHESLRLAKTPENSLRVDRLELDDSEMDCTSYTTDVSNLLMDDISPDVMATISEEEPDMLNLDEQPIQFENMREPPSREQSYVSALSEQLFEDSQDKSMSDSIDPKIMIVDVIDDEFSERLAIETPSGTPAHFTKFNLEDVDPHDNENIVDALSERKELFFGTDNLDANFDSNATSDTAISIDPPPLEIVGTGPSLNLSIAQTSTIISVGDAPTPPQSNLYMAETPSLQTIISTGETPQPIEDTDSLPETPSASSVAFTPEPSILIVQEKSSDTMHDRSESGIEDIAPAKTVDNSIEVLGTFESVQKQSDDKIQDKVEENAQEQANATVDPNLENQENKLLTSSQYYQNLNKEWGLALGNYKENVQKQMVDAEVHDSNTVQAEAVSDDIAAGSDELPPEEACTSPKLKSEPSFGGKELFEEVSGEVKRKETKEIDAILSEMRVELKPGSTRPDSAGEAGESPAEKAEVKSEDTQTNDTANPVETPPVNNSVVTGALEELLQQSKHKSEGSLPPFDLENLLMESDEEEVDGVQMGGSVLVTPLATQHDSFSENWAHPAVTPKKASFTPVEKFKDSRKKISRATTLENIPAFSDPLTAHLKKSNSASMFHIPQTLKNLGSAEYHPLVYISGESERETPGSPSESIVFLSKEIAAKEKNQKGSSDKDLWLLIMKDVERTLQKRAEFHDLKIKYLLANILFIWAKENQTIGYQQGMNELVAMIIVALSHDCDQVQDISDEEDPFELKTLLTPVYLEHDVYTLFDLMIQKIKGFYEPDNTVLMQPWLGGLLQDMHNDTITKKLFHIHHRLLRYLDLTLYNHLRSLQIHPQHYLFRWIRLLLCREFETLTSLTVWDRIFYESEGDRELFLMDFFCVAIIILKRDQIMALQDMSVVQLLQNQEDQLKDITVELLVEKATELQGKWMEGPKHEYTPSQLVAFRMEANGEFTATPDVSWPSEYLSVTNDNGVKSMGMKKVYIHGMKPLGIEEADHIKWCLFSHYGPHFILKNDTILREGYLVKRGGGKSVFGRRSFKRRWTVISGNKLAYFKNRSKSTPQREWIDLPGRTVTVVSSEHFAFTVSGTTSEARRILFFAQNEKEFLLWLHALTLSCEIVEFYT